MNNFLSRMRESDALSGRFSRYLIVGGSAAIVDLGGFFLFLMADFPIAAAAASSFAAAAVYNFVLSSTLVFRLAPNLPRLFMFMAFAFVGLVVNTGVTSLAAIAMPDLPAKAVGISMAFGVNFWMNNSIVFKAPENSSTS